MTAGRTAVLRVGDRVSFDAAVYPEAVTVTSLVLPPTGSASLPPAWLAPVPRRGCAAAHLPEYAPYSAHDPLLRWVWRDADMDRCAQTSRGLNQRSGSWRSRRRRPRVCSSWAR